jgi:hypothetical protein
MKFPIKTNHLNDIGLPLELKVILKKKNLKDIFIILTNLLKDNTDEAKEIDIFEYYINTHNNNTEFKALYPEYLTIIDKSYKEGLISYIVGNNIKKVKLTNKGISLANRILKIGD